ncbi:vesicle transport through interaction with t-SNAREs homolog 1B [Bemisia tabaci]|uniref:vesicle transport through interaction with t-SNAREs homolog 1B n=1 Tax=Bemisia tabaci TaxID=7038 RepID=UPI0008F9E2EA|nr:PREDICTED: vesicle transport through interaction with t-SNAREs homolog 1B [Bemisia tabaci]
MEQAQRQTLLESRNALERTSQSLGRSQRTAVETEIIGTEVLAELGSQRETLLRARNRITDTNEQLTEAHRILYAMRRQIFTNKIVLIFIIVTEILVLGLMLYVKFIRNRF